MRSKNDADKEFDHSVDLDTGIGASRVEEQEVDASNARTAGAESDDDMRAEESGDEGEPADGRTETAKKTVKVQVTKSVDGEEAGTGAPQGYDHGYKLEPFNLKQERREGAFDAAGNYQWHKEDKEDVDPWLESIKGEAVYQPRGGAGAQAEEAEDIPQDLLAVRRRMAALMQPGETVAAALRRYGGGRQTAAAASATAAQAARRRRREAAKAAKAAKAAAADAPAADAGVQGRKRARAGEASTTQAPVRVGASAEADGTPAKRTRAGAEPADTRGTADRRADAFDLLTAGADALLRSGGADGFAVSRERLLDAVRTEEAGRRAEAAAAGVRGPLADTMWVYRPLQAPPARGGEARGGDSDSGDGGSDPVIQGPFTFASLLGWRRAGFFTGAQHAALRLIAGQDALIPALSKAEGGPGKVEGAEPSAMDDLEAAFDEEDGDEEGDGEDGEGAAAGQRHAGKTWAAIAEALARGWVSSRDLDLLELATFE